MATQIFKQLEHDTLIEVLNFQSSSPVKDDISRKMAVKYLLEDITFNGVKSLIQELKLDELIKATSHLKIDHGTNNPKSKMVLSKRLKESFEEYGPSEWLNNCGDETVLKTFAYILGVKDALKLSSKALRPAIEKEITSTGLVLLFENLNIPLLKKCCEELEIENFEYASGKNALVKAIVFDVAIAAPEKKKKKAVRVGAKKPIEKCNEYEQLFQHYTLEQLVDWCKERDVKTSGTKKVVINRILDYNDGDRENTMVDATNRSPKQVRKTETKEKAKPKKAKLSVKQAEDAKESEEEGDDEETTKEVEKEKATTKKAAAKKNVKKTTKKATKDKSEEENEEDPAEEVEEEVKEKVKTNKKGAKKAAGKDKKMKEKSTEEEEDNKSAEEEEEVKEKAKTKKGAKKAAGKDKKMKEKSTEEEEDDQKSAEEEEKEEVKEKAKTNKKVVAKKATGKDKKMKEKSTEEEDDQISAEEEEKEEIKDTKTAGKKAGKDKKMKEKSEEEEKSEEKEAKDKKKEKKAAVVDKKKESKKVVEENSNEEEEKEKETKKTTKKADKKEKVKEPSEEAKEETEASETLDIEAAIAAERKLRTTSVEPSEVSVTPDDEEDDAEHPRDITGVHFAINGQLSLKQDVVKTAIEKAGGVVCNQLTKKVNILVTNNDASSSKFDKARSVGIKIVSEDYLTHILAPYRD